MRVQHNIVAMNSYRNYNNNTGMINKNLEKLSSGYKINRAGDDAAGLAISEKMRAQITGLEGAQKNAKDGISLVQTAEGALTEVHSMLNRMYKLAEQSANGTYDSTTDRAQLQKEVDSLRTEINRIADSSNFNGLNLLDGSLSGASQVDNLAVTESVAIKGVYTSGTLAKPFQGKDVTGATVGLTKDDIGKTMDLTVTWKTGSGEEKTTKVSLTFQGTGGDEPIVATAAANVATAKYHKNDNYFTDVNGTKYYLSTTGTLKATDVMDALKAGLERDEEFSSAFELDTTSNKFTFTAKVAGTAGGSITSLGVTETFAATKATVWNGATAANKIENPVTVSEALDAMQKFDASKLSVGKSGDTGDVLSGKIFEIDGHKFLAATSNLTNDQRKALGDDVTIVEVANATADNGDTKKIAAEVTRVTGLTTDVKSEENEKASIKTTDILFTKDRLRLSGSALTLQIGDTAAKYNQLDVQIGDIHSNKLGNDTTKLDAIDISKQDGAQKAMDALKAAINTVSDIRGTLGATQNRLEHTINNLSVMQENIQDAESTIRDTDVADEMMKYTKNSILVQSAQAMLAQANQQPQGVLQLLQ